MILLAASLAFAQDDVITVDYPIDIERFRPTPDTYGYAITESCTTLRNLQVGTGMWVNYSDDPLVLFWNGQRVLGPGPTFPDGLVNQRSVVDLQVGLGLADIFSLSVDAPVVVWQQGFEPAAQNSPVATSDLNSAALGDIRIHPKFVFADIRTDGVPAGLSFSGDFTVPTGSLRSFIGEGGITASPMLNFEVADGSVRDRDYNVRAAINAGARFKQPDTFRDLELGPEFVYRAAIAAHPPGVFEVGGDIGGSVSGSRIAQNEVEILPWMKLFPAWVTLTGGAGFGLAPGVGSPDYRLFFGATLGPNFDPLLLDRDGDGIPNKLDQCINIPEDKDGFEDDDGCPEDDNDKDGIKDPSDACPNDPEDVDGFQDEDGCPDPDNDQDRILDVVDSCPMEPEDYDGDRDQDGCPESPADSDGDGLTDDVDRCPYDPEDKDGFQDQDGCPELDNDQDTILDVVDQCPMDPENFNGYLDQDGCPDAASRVIVEKERIVITEKIFFEYNKAIIKEISFELLNEIASVMNQHPEVTKIQVEGHTDSDGSATYNLKLSQARAEAVMHYLVSAGVSASRLSAVGYGEERPIDTNETAEGKAQNRRVEFTILAREE